MTRFILLSFVFLGIAFYEMSGGRDFDPVEARTAAVLARGGTPDAQQQADVQVAQAAPARQNDDAPTVTRMSLNLTSFSDVIAQDEPVPAPAVLAPALDLTPIKPVTFQTASEQQAVLPSIIFSGSTSQASSDAVTSGRDVRFISADVANMRGGPGTGFDVVTKLERDTQVEILQDTGTGWVKLRPLAGGPEGWIADFLLTSG